MLKMKSIDDFIYDDKTVLLRLDINSPINVETKKIVNENRIKKSLPTIQKILDEFSELIPRIENSLKPFNGIYDDVSYLWFEVNSIKNPIFKLKN